jgi:hypothetical protein
MGIGDRHNLIAVAAERAFQGTPESRFIVYDENAGTHDAA